mmetsp:Transcript_12232/g.31268  ORF Transcript_12232/g.31268 Transcript_12232/m.31268 type:complete len:318 (+) Transcript_12232:2-955(+)
MLLDASIVSAALEPLCAETLVEAGVRTVIAVGISHGASLAQCFHLYFNQTQQRWREDHPDQTTVKLRSVHFGAYRWTDTYGAKVFSELTGCQMVQKEVDLEQSDAELPEQSTLSSERTAIVMAAEGDAIAISLQDPSQPHVVDPIPRVDWRCGVFFWRRGYVSVVDPIGLVATSGEVVTLEARARQRRRLFVGSAPFRVKYHLASNYRTATSKLTSQFQKKKSSTENTARLSSWVRARGHWGDAAAGVKKMFVKNANESSAEKSTAAGSGGVVLMTNSPKSVDGTTAVPNTVAEEATAAVTQVAVIPAATQVATPPE